MAIKVNWVKCKGDVWCSLHRVKLDGLDVSGVYVIWQPGNPGRVVRVGQGDVADRIHDHRQDPEIIKYGDDLLVTWARVPEHQQDGVERYLAERFEPLAGDRFPVDPPISVNLPGE